MKKTVPIMIGTMFYKVLDEQNLSEEKKEEMIELLHSGDGYSNKDFLSYMKLAQQKLQELVDAQVANREANKDNNPETTRIERRTRRELPAMLSQMLATVMRDYGCSDEKIMQSYKKLQSPNYMRDDAELEQYLQEAYSRLDELFEQRTMGSK